MLRVKIHTDEMANLLPTQRLLLIVLDQEVSVILGSLIRWPKQLYSCFEIFLKIKGLNNIRQTVAGSTCTRDKKIWFNR